MFSQFEKKRVEWVHDAGRPNSLYQRCLEFLAVLQERWLSFLWSESYNILLCVISLAHRDATLEFGSNLMLLSQSIKQLRENFNNATFIVSLLFMSWYVSDSIYSLLSIFSLNLHYIHMAVGCSRTNIYSADITNFNMLTICTTTHPLSCWFAVPPYGSHIEIEG